MFGRDVFESLKKGEKIVIIVRKHWASFAKQILITFLVLFPPFFLIVFFFSRWWTMLIFFLWVFTGFGYALYQWFVWHYDSLVVTTFRVINIDQKSLFSRSVSETPLSQIQDITYEVQGMRASLFNYGTINIASAASTMKIEHIQDPEEVRDAIFDLRERKTNKKKKEVSAEDLISFIKKHS